MKPRVATPRSSPARRVFARPRQPIPWRQGLSGLLMLALGAGLLVGLMQLPERLDTLLMISTAVANLIGGLSRFLTGLLQLLAVLLLVLLAIGSLLLLVGGCIRLVRALLRQQAKRSRHSRGPQR